MVNSLKMSVFTLAASLSMSVMATDATDNATGSDRNSNNLNASESMKMHNCAGKNADDTTLREKEMQNEESNAMTNENSRLN